MSGRLHRVESKSASERPRKTSWKGLSELKSQGVTKIKSDECGSVGGVSYWEKKCKGQRSRKEWYICVMAHSLVLLEIQGVNMCVCV